jgi:hypothetical protein
MEESEMEEESETPSPPKPSQVPSWISLGFVLGALFILALPRRGAVEPTVTASDQPAAKPSEHREPLRLTTIEAVFAAWDKYAVWSNGTTEVALWNSETKEFSDCYEVTKVGGEYYFRSIPSLTRPILTHGVVTESPLQFTETLRQRDEWLGEVDKENWKALADAARESMAPAAQAKPADGK